MLTRLATLATLVVALFAGSASIAESKIPGGNLGTEDTCAAPLVDELVAALATEDAEACGGYVWFTFNGGYYDAGANYTRCFYTQHPNGQQIATSYPGVWSCPSTP